MRKLIFTSLLLVISTIGFTQQDPMYSQYVFDRTAINPAYVGAIPVFRANLAYRQQFTGLKGAPITEKLTIAAPIQKNRWVLGLTLLMTKPVLIKLRPSMDCILIQLELEKANFPLVFKVVWPIILLIFQIW